MKRFTETDKWRDAWYRGLSPVHKCLWNYLVDNCDPCGVIDPDWELISFQIGAQVSELDLNRFEKQVEKLPSGKLLITGFVAFQYGQLSTECKPHKPVFAALKRHGIEIQRVSKGYPKGISTLQDKEKDKESDKKEEVQEEPKRINTRETNRTFPESINTGAVRLAWGNWLEFFSAEFCGGKPVNQQTADAHFQVLCSLGPIKAVQAVDNAILKRLRVPSLDFAQQPKTPASQIRIQT